MFASRLHARIIHYSSTRFLGKKSVRPSLDDIELLGLGKAPLKEDMEAHTVHYRLNKEEREQFEVFKRNKFLLVKNFGHRREIGDYPIMNLSRLYSDALGMPFICVSTDVTITEDMVGPPSVVKIDYSTMRQTDLTDPLRLCTDEINLSEFPSIEEYYDEEVLSRDDIATTLNDYKFNPIWKVPKKNLIIHFRMRNDAVHFAKKISTLIEQGSLVAN